MSIPLYYATLSHRCTTISPAPVPIHLSSFPAFSLPLPHQHQLFHFNTFTQSLHLPPEAHPTHNRLKSSHLLPHPSMSNTPPCLHSTSTSPMSTSSPPTLLDM